MPSMTGPLYVDGMPISGYNPAGRDFLVNTNTASAARNKDREWFNVAQSAGRVVPSTGDPTVFNTLQGAIDACVDDRGDRIWVARAYTAIATPILFNKAGISVRLQDFGMPPLEVGEYATFDNTTGGAAAAYITRPCAIEGLGFHTAWTGGISANVIFEDLNDGWPGWLYMKHCRIMNWGTATLYGINFEAGANCVIEKCTFEGTAGQPFTAGVSFGSTGTNNPIQNTVEDCRFRDCTYGIGHREGTPQNFLYHDNKFIDSKILDSNGLTADGLVSGNWSELAAASSYDAAVATLQGYGINFSGNNYSE